MSKILQKYLETIQLISIYKTIKNINVNSNYLNLITANESDKNSKYWYIQYPVEQEWKNLTNLVSIPLVEIL